MEKKHNIKRPKRQSKYYQYYNSKTEQYHCPKCKKNYYKGSDLGAHMEQKHNIKRSQIGKRK